MGESAFVGHILSALRKAPLWLLAGLAIAGCVILFAPPGVREVDLTGFRAKFGPLIWACTVISAVLALACAIDTACRNLPSWLYRPLRITPFLPACRWFLTQQPDGSFSSQVILPCDVLNTAVGTAGIVRTWIIRPTVRPELVQPILLGGEKLPAQASQRLALTFLVRRALGAQGQTLHLTIGFMDHAARKYRVKAIATPPPRTH